MTYVCTSRSCLKSAGKSENNTRGIETESYKKDGFYYCCECNHLMRKGKVNRFASVSSHKRTIELKSLERRRP
jgi:hypothetical protein